MVNEMPTKFQYYYKQDHCKASSSKDANCICWHDEGTGHHKTEKHDDISSMLSWRSVSVVELLDCPCCGGKAQFSGCVNYVTIFCTNCGIRTNDEYGYDYEAIKIKVTNRWNKRATNALLCGERSESDNSK
jgi:hypothetical protein